MAVYIDPASWPAHGTVFAHLISDTSLTELHDLAERAGCHPRAFDRDHYDVPLRLHQACLDAGAVPVSARELVQRLRGSGLRFTKAMARAEHEARRARLAARWPLSRELAEDLLDRWSAPRRYYHDLQHLEECLTALDLLGGAERPVVLATWFHDAIYTGHAGEDEEASARLAEEHLTALPGVSAAERGEVARLVRLTAGHQPADDDARGHLMCDADLAILGAAPDRYEDYRRAIRREYAEVPLEEFRRGRARVLTHLAALDPLYRTATAQATWTDPARANLATEITRLTAA